MSDGVEAFMIGAVILVFSIIFWNLGYNLGEQVERAKVVESDDYIEDIRALDTANKKAKALEEKIK